MKQSLLSFGRGSQTQDLPTSADASSASAVLPSAAADIVTAPPPAESASTSSTSQKLAAARSAVPGPTDKNAKSGAKVSKKAQPKKASKKVPPPSTFFQPVKARKDAAAAEEHSKGAATEIASTTVEVDEESDAESAVNIATSRPRRKPATSVIVIHDDNDNDDDYEDEVIIKHVKSAASSQEVKKQSPLKSNLPAASSSFTVKGTGPSSRPFKPFANRPNNILNHVPWPKGENVHVQPADALIPFDTSMHHKVPEVRADISERETSPSEPFNFQQALKARARGPSDYFLMTQSEQPLAFSSTLITLEAALSALAALAKAHDLEHHILSGKQTADSALSYAFKGAYEALTINKTDQEHDRYELWTHSHRPRRASHVLGKRNRESAAYLKDWLHELVISEPVTTVAAAVNATAQTNLILSASSNQGMKGIMKGLQKKRKAGTSSVDPSRRKIQRRVDKKGDREKRAKAARRARRGWSELDDSDEDDIVDFIVDDELDVVYESEDDEILDWSSQNSQARASTPGDVPTSSLPEPTDPTPLTPNKKEGAAQDSATPLSSSPVIGPGRVRTNRTTDPTTPTKSRTLNAPIAQPSPRKRNTFKEHLTNCILLQGPTGVGKTAAVYACAAELGYEVFELFPGMGRRRGKEMEAAVGALAANHMVSGGGSGGGAKQQFSKQQQQKVGKPTTRMSDISALFGSRKVREKEEDTTVAETGADDGRRSQLEDDVQARAMTNGGPDALRVPTSPKGTKVVRQSLILIEEADILYEDDRGFWPAMIELIGKSRRPVIITCNDPSSIPIADLPLQITLPFTSATLDEAVPYLQLVAIREGHVLSPKDATRIYNSTKSSLRLDTSFSLAGLSSHGPVRASAPSTVHGIEKSSSDGNAAHVYDLRQALLETQFWCSTADSLESGKKSWHATVFAATDREKANSVERSSEPRPDQDDLVTIGKVLDALSFADASLQPPFLDVVEAYEPDAYQGRMASSSSLRDQLLNEEAHMLPKQGRKDEEQMLAESGVRVASELQDACMNSCLQMWSQAYVVADQHGAFEQRVRHAQAVSKLVDDVEGRAVVTDASCILRPECLILDYAPYLRAMVRVDDAEAARHAEAVESAKVAAAAATEEGSMNPFMQLRLTRHTRNSQQSVLTAYGIYGGEEYARYIWTSEAVLAAIRECAFSRTESCSVLNADRPGDIEGGPDTDELSKTETSARSAVLSESFI